MLKRIVLTWLFKKYVTHSMAFFESLLQCHPFSFFSLPYPLLCHSLKNEKLWHETKEDFYVCLPNNVFCMTALSCHILSKQVIIGCVFIVAQYFHILFFMKYRLAKIGLYLKGSQKNEELLTLLLHWCTFCMTPCWRPPMKLITSFFKKKSLQVSTFYDLIRINYVSNEANHTQVYNLISVLKSTYFILRW